VYDHNSSRQLEDLGKFYDIKEVMQIGLFYDANLLVDADVNLDSKAAALKAKNSKAWQPVYWGCVCRILDRACTASKY